MSRIYGEMSFNEYMARFGGEPVFEPEEKFEAEISLEEAFEILKELPKEIREVAEAYYFGQDESGGLLLEAIQLAFSEKPENCICSEKSLESYGCTCQKRVQPGI